MRSGQGADERGAVRGSHVQFAGSSTGYLYGPALLMTTDGGRDWQVQPGLQVEALTVVGRTVYRVAYDHAGCPGPCQPALQEAAIGSGVWRTLMNPITTRGESGSAQVVASGPALLLGVYGNLAADRLAAQAALYRSVDGGQSWQREARGGAGPPTTDLLVSFDAGAHWSTAATDSVEPTQLEPHAWIGFQSPESARWVSGPHTIWTTEDGGRTWSKTAFR